MYKNTDQDKLWHYLTLAAHKDGSLPDGLTVKNIMDTWTLQEGFPVLCVQRNDNVTATLTQVIPMSGNSDMIGSIFIFKCIYFSVFRIFDIRNTLSYLLEIST